MRTVKFLCGLLMILISFSVQAEKFRSNEIKFGRPQSSEDKVIYYGANGIMRYNETASKFEMSSNGGANWFEVQPVGGFADNALNNLLAPTAVNIPLLPVSGSSIDMGSLLFPWGDIMVGYDTNAHFIVVDPSTNASALEIGATTSFNGNSWGINAPVNNTRLWLSLRTANNPAGPSNGISIETGDATLAGDSGDILIKTGEENLTGGARGEVLFNAGIVDFQNVATVDFSGVTVLGIAGGGGGILWSTAVNADILPSSNNTYNLGASNNYFVTVNGATGKFANIDNLTGVPINVLQDLVMTGLDITGLNAITVDSINETGASGITFNGVELKNVADPTSAQSVATRNYVDTELALAVGFDPSAILVDLIPNTDNANDIGSASKRWAEGYFTSIKSLQSIEALAGQSLSIKTNDEAGSLSEDLNLESGSSNLVGGGGAILLKSGDNAIGESGNVTIQSGSAGTTRGEISLNGSQVNANNTQIVNVLDPTTDQMVATKKYVDDEIAGVGGGGGTDWTVPIDNNITTDGGNYDIGTMSAPLQNLFSQELTLTDKTKMELSLVSTNGTTPAGFGYETAMRILGGNGAGFAIYGDSDATVDANPTKNIYIETGNKSAGTGNSGDIYIQTGTSAGGDRGSVIISAGGMSLSSGNIIDLANPVDNGDAVNLGFLNTQLGGKEDSFGSGTTLQYLRGDKSYQTLNTSVVPEGTNLYYTEGRFDTSLSGKSTTNLSEGTNLYHTSERVDDRVNALLQTGTGLAWTYDDGSNTLTGNVSLSSFSTTNLSEGTNLYYTNTRADARISLQRGAVNGVASLDGNGKVPSSQMPPLALTDVYVVANETAQLAIDPIEEGDVVIRTDESKSYAHNGGSADTMADFSELLSPSDAVLSVNGNTGAVSLSTTDISEGTNLYYTDGRFDTRLGLKSTTDLTEGTNLYYTAGRFDTAFGGKSTTNLSEGTNLYYTQGRFDTAFGAEDTDSLSEGSSNLYYTNTRAISAPITGFSSGSGTVLATDTILQALQKIDGNVSAGAVTSLGDLTDVGTLTSNRMAYMNGSGVLTASDVVYNESTNTMVFPSSSTIQMSSYDILSDSIRSFNNSNTTINSRGTGKLAIQDSGTQVMAVDSEGVELKQVTSFSNPISGSNKIYFKNDDKLYKRTSAGVETEVGGTAGANTTLSNLGTTAINANLLFDGATRNIGTTTNQVNVLYASFISVIQGSTANWTMGASSYSHNGHSFNGKLESGTNGTFAMVSKTQSTTATKDIHVLTGEVNGTSSTVNSGKVIIESGNIAGTGFSGAIQIESGESVKTTGTGTSGDLNFKSGDTHASATGNSGDINLTAGSASLEGLRGDLNINTRRINLTGIIQIDQISTPVDSPSASTNKLYFKSDNNLYKMDSSGNELQVGVGAVQDFSLTNNVTATNLTGLVYDKLEIKSAKLTINIERRTDTGVEQLEEFGTLWITHQTETDTWRIFLQSFGDDAGVTFTITSGGQIQYATTNLAGASYAGELKVGTVQVVAQ